MSEQNIPKQKRIKPRLLKGFRDYLSSELIAREKLVNKIKSIYELYGYTPLSTPAIEYFEVLVGGGYGEEGHKQIYNFKDFEEENVGLRFDLTVPLARVFSQYPDLPKPFRRYQIAPVWRGDKPDPGRFREFIQFDIDIVGAPLLTADVEIISVAHDAFKSIGLDKFIIKVNSRKILNLLLKKANIEEELSKKVIRVIDKLDKQGIEAVYSELMQGRIDKSGDKIPGLGLSSEQADIIKEYLIHPKGNRSNTILFIKDFFGSITDSEEAINELETLNLYLTELNLSEEYVTFDLTLARGLDYYTGIIFEANLTDLPEYGSVFGGGRYDGLVERFTGEKVPSTGASIGIDRLFSALIKLNKLQLKPTATQVIVTTFEKELFVEYLKIADELRKNGINAELYQGRPKGIKKQLEYADKLEIPLAVIMGSDEFNNGQVTIKNLLEGSKTGVEIKERDEYLKQRFAQMTIPRNELVTQIKDILQEII